MSDPLPEKGEVNVSGLASISHLSMTSNIIPGIDACGMKASVSAWTYGNWTLKEHYVYSKGITSVDASTGAFYVADKSTLNSNITPILTNLVINAATTTQPTTVAEYKGYDSSSKQFMFILHNAPDDLTAAGLTVLFTAVRGEYGTSVTDSSKNMMRGRLKRLQTLLKRVAQQFELRST